GGVFRRDGQGEQLLRRVQVDARQRRRQTLIVVQLDVRRTRQDLRHALYDRICDLLVMTRQRGQEVLFGSRLSEFVGTEQLEERAGGFWRRFLRDGERLP